MYYTSLMHTEHLQLLAAVLLALTILEHCKKTWEKQQINCNLEPAVWDLNLKMNIPF